MKIKLYVDMDGTLAEFKKVNKIDELYQENYFRNLEPLQNVVEAIKQLSHSELEVYILSSYLQDSKYALNEKNEWLDKFLPEIDAEHRKFVRYGTEKVDAIKEFGNHCILLDDCTSHLVNWKENGGIAIKLINPINDTTKKWNGLKVEYNLNPTLLVYTIKRMAIEGYVQKKGIKNMMIQAKHFKEKAHQDNLKVKKQKLDLNVSK